MNLTIMTQFDMSTIVKKLQDMSRKRRFLISAVEKIEKITRLLLFSQATNAESDGINTYVLLIYLYFISNERGAVKTQLFYCCYGPEKSTLILLLHHSEPN